MKVRPLEAVVAPVSSTEAPVTPIVATQELRSFFQQPEPVLNTDPAADLEVIDLRAEEQAAGLPLINDDGDVEVEDTILPETIIEEEQEATTVGAVEPVITTTQTPAQTATTDRPQVEFINRNASNDLAKSDGIVSFL